jgi:hypothetical protein
VVTKGPYLQALGPSEVTIKLELGEPGPAAVVVSAAVGGPPVARAEETEARAFHALHVGGLSPATSYVYRVTAGKAAVEAAHFTTAPIDTRPFRFLVYGDSRTDAEAHAAVIRAMEAVPSDFLVNTGDMVDMGNQPEDWGELFSIEGRLLRDRCVFVAVGNHELARGDRAGAVAFLRYFAGTDQGQELTQLYGSFRWSNTRFFVLNAMDTWTGAERDWLRAELDRALDEPGIVHRIAVMHWGPYSSGPHGNNPALESGEVTRAMRERKVDLILAGHDHAYERGEGQGLKYVVTGGAGAPLYPRKTNGAEARRYESTYHFLEVAVDGESVKVTARRPSGVVLETCGFHGEGPWDCDADTPALLPKIPDGGPRSEASPASPTRASLAAPVLVAGGVVAAAAVAVLSRGGRRRRGHREKRHDHR